MQQPEGHQHPGGPGRSRLGPHVVGQRVVVRHLLPDGRATDVLGVCTSWDAGSLTIESDRATVTIPLTSVVTGKPVPPRASVRARATPREVESHTAVLWPRLESEPLGAWTLRHCPPGDDDRWRRRANSVLAMGEPVPEDADVRIREWYAARGRPAQAQVVTGSPEEDHLLGRGWSPLGRGGAHCQLASVASALRAARTLVPPGPDPRYLEEGPRVRVELGDGCSGEAAVDGDWLGVHSLEVDPALRRTGLGTAVVSTLLDWGAEHGARTAWLHVETDNAPAMALYARLGFVTHHTYGYLTAPGADG